MLHEGPWGWDGGPGALLWDGMGMGALSAHFPLGWDGSPSAHSGWDEMGAQCTLSPWDGMGAQCTLPLDRLFFPYPQPLSSCSPGN